MRHPTFTVGKFADKIGLVVALVDKDFFGDMVIFGLERSRSGNGGADFGSHVLHVVKRGGEMIDGAGINYSIIFTVSQIIRFDTNGERFSTFKILGGSSAGNFAVSVLGILSEGRIGARFTCDSHFEVGGINERGGMHAETEIDSFAAGETKGPIWRIEGDFGSGLVGRLADGGIKDVNRVCTGSDAGVNKETIIYRNCQGGDIATIGSSALEDEFGLGAFGDAEEFGGGGLIGVVADRIKALNQTARGSKAPSVGEEDIGSVSEGGGGDGGIGGSGGIGESGSVLGGGNIEFEARTSVSIDGNLTHNRGEGPLGHGVNFEIDGSGRHLNGKIMITFADDGGSIGIGGGPEVEDQEDEYGEQEEATKLKAGFRIGSKNNAKMTEKISDNNTASQIVHGFIVALAKAEW